MKAQYSEEFYRKHWDKFIKAVPGNHYINLEAELEHAMETFAGIPTEALEVLKKVEAEKIANKCKALVLNEMATIKALENGEASLGYTTRGQEIKARGDLRTRFEFNCLQLKVFKEKYGISA